MNFEMYERCRLKENKLKQISRADNFANFIEGT